MSLTCGTRARGFTCINLSQASLFPLFLPITPPSGFHKIGTHVPKTVIQIILFPCVKLQWLFMTLRIRSQLLPMACGTLPAWPSLTLGANLPLSPSGPASPVFLLFSNSPAVFSLQSYSFLPLNHLLSLSRSLQMSPSLITHFTVAQSLFSN